MPYKNPEDNRRYAREYYRKHREDVLAYQKRYGVENRKSLNEKCRIWRLKNPGYSTVISKDWRIKNPARFKEIARESYKAKVISGACRAQRSVNWRVKTGKLKRLSEEIVECVHRDYNKPLDVVPVCRKCNHARGAAIPLL